MIFTMKKVSFSEKLTEIKYYEYTQEEIIEEKKGKNWNETVDLIFREYTKPYLEGGCNNNWFILEKRLQLLDEPNWLLIGQHWNRLYPGMKRYEELNQFVRVYISKNMDDESDSESDNDGASDGASDNIA